MRIEIDLLGQIGIGVFPQVVADQGEWYQQREDAGAVLVDGIAELLLLGRGQHPLEITLQVHQHIGVAATVGTQGQGRHQALDVAVRHLLQVGLAEVAEQLAEGAVVGSGVGEHQILVTRMEPDEGGGGDTASTELLPVVIGEDPQHEVLPQYGIAQAAILLHRQQWVGRHQRLGKEAYPLLGAPLVVGTIDAHPLHAAAGGLGAEDVTGEEIELARFLLAEGDEPLGDVEAAVARLGTHLPMALDQADGGARRAEADGHLGADGVIVEVSAKIPFAEAGALVAPVEPHFLPQQTGTDTDLDLVHDDAPCISIEPVIAVIQRNESCITITDRYDTRGKTGSPENEKAHDRGHGQNERCDRQGNQKLYFTPRLLMDPFCRSQLR
ncbi:hypothetical protein D3C85_642490 [compost metagenome]